MKRPSPIPVKPAPDLPLTELFQNPNANIPLFLLAYTMNKGKLTEAHKDALLGNPLTPDTVLLSLYRTFKDRWTEEDTEKFIRRQRLKTATLETFLDEGGPEVVQTFMNMKEVKPSTRVALYVAEKANDYGIHIRDVVEWVNIEDIANVIAAAYPRDPYTLYTRARYFYHGYPYRPAVLRENPNDDEEVAGKKREANEAIKQIIHMSVRLVSGSDDVVRKRAKLREDYVRKMYPEVDVQFLPDDVIERYTEGAWFEEPLLQPGRTANGEF